MLTPETRARQVQFVPMQLSVHNENSSNNVPIGEMTTFKP